MGHKIADAADALLGAVASAAFNPLV